MCFIIFIPERSSTLFSHNTNQAPKKSPYTTIYTNKFNHTKQKQPQYNANHELLTQTQTTQAKYKLYRLNPILNNIYILIPQKRCFEADLR